MDQSIVNIFKHGSLDTIIELIRSINDVNIVDTKGNNLLHLVVHNSTYRHLVTMRVIDELIFRGINVNHRNHKDKTPLHKASGSNNYEIVAKLLSHGADPDIVDIWSRTPLYLAALRRYPKVVQVLLDGGANPNIYDEYLRPPLFWAAYFGNLTIVKQLFDNVNTAVTDPNLATNSGRTPLYIAAERGHIKVVEELLSRGADPTITDTRNRGPLDKAREHGCSNTANLLKNYLPTFQTMCIRCIRANRIVVSKLPSVLFS